MQGKIRQQTRTQKNIIALEESKKNGVIEESILFFNNTFIRDYTELEYIESTGTQWIDTGVNYLTTISVEIDLNASSGHPLGIVSQGFYMSGIAILTKNDIDYYSARWRYSDKNDNVYSSVTAGQRALIKIDKYKFIVNNLEYSNAHADSMQGTSQSISIFAVHDISGGVQALTTMKLYSCKICDNNILVRNFIPAKRNSDNEIGLYDVVNNTFYTNQGTGSFIAGLKKED